mgnify:CR=1 FL=1
MAIHFYSDIHLNANKLGRDADNLLDFSTDNQITFRVGAGDGVIFKASGEIEATKFDGALEGNADTATLATNATHVTVTDNESTNEENLIPFIEDTSATGNVGLESDGDFAYNPSTGTVTATVFSGNYAVGGHTIDDIDITAEFVDADAHIMSSKAIGARFALKNADTTGTATNALHVLITDNESTDEECEITFIEGAAGGTAQRGLEADGDLTYNPSSGTLSSTVFKGNYAVGGHTFDDIDITSEFVDADAHIMSSKAIGARFSLKAGSASITTLGTIGTGVWNGTVIASAKLDADTAHLATAQTFTAAKTFGTTNKLQFRDANAYINSPTANDIEIAATSIVLDAANDIQLEQNTTVTGNLTVSGKNLSPSTSINDFATAAFENDSTLLASGATGNGRVMKYSPGDATSLTVGQIYYLGSDGIWATTDADNVAKGGSQLLGVGLGAPRTAGVFMEGFIGIPLTEILNVPGSGAVDGLPLYVSTTDGHFDFTAPSGGSDYVRIVGYAIDDTTGDEGVVLVYFCPSKDHILLA